MNGSLLKIGQLAKLTGVLPSTINFYTKEGLIVAAERSRGGYRLYHPSAVQQIKSIQKFQVDMRLTIAEIRDRMAGRRFTP